MPCAGLTILDYTEARDVNPVIGFDHDHRLRRSSRNAGRCCANRAATRRFPNPTSAEFQLIADRADRSRAIFAEIGTVLTHPRCMNCHPAGEHPLQGADHHEHKPVVWRSDTRNYGTPCGECHTEQNVALREAASYRSIPGHPRLGVAPLSMAWEHKSIGDICRQLKDTARNGGRDLAMLQEHVTKDDLVACGWNPELAASPSREASRRRENWSRHGSTTAQSARHKASPTTGLQG
jgi:hypothetical protein